MSDAAKQSIQNEYEQYTDSVRVRNSKVACALVIALKYEKGARFQRFEASPSATRGPLSVSTHAMGRGTSTCANA